MRCMTVTVRLSTKKYVSKSLIKFVNKHTKSNARHLPNCTVNMAPSLSVFKLKFKNAILSLMLSMKPSVILLRRRNV